MALKDGRKPQPANSQNRERHSENVGGRLGVSEREGIPIGHDSNSVFYSDSEGTNKTGEWIATGGQTTPGGIRRRLNELYSACLNLIESQQSQQKQLESSLRESQTLAEEIQSLQALLTEINESFAEKE